MATQDLTFSWIQTIADRWDLFVYASYTLLLARSLVFMVATGQDDVLVSCDLSRERDKLEEKCETLERDNSTVEKE